MLVALYQCMLPRIALPELCSQRNQYLSDSSKSSGRPQTRMPKKRDYRPACAEGHLLNTDGLHAAHSSQDNVEAFKRRVMVDQTVFKCRFLVWPIEG